MQKHVSATGPTHSMSVYIVTHFGSLTKLSTDGHFQTSLDLISQTQFV